MSQRLTVVRSQLACPEVNVVPVAAAKKNIQIQFSPEVQHAMDDGPAGIRRIVALESTIISHGMPYPENVACARQLESIVREEGAVPATICIIDGVVHVGVDESTLERLGQEGPKCAKVSRRDLPLILAKGNVCGATTVSGTILIAHMCGIRVMATGGIGGVHRKGEVTMDVSADLVELGHTPVLVVCAGVKSILDIGRTLEFLETQGVAVMAFGTNEFPAFFTRKSGVKAPLRIDTVVEAARYIDTVEALGYRGGGILAVPIHAKHEADGDLVERAIVTSLREVEQTAVLGRDVTPYVLKRVAQLTEGKSLASNIELVKQNTRIAAQIAMARR